MRSQDFLNEDWQKANKSDKTDGMSQKAVNAYRRENPGSKLKTAVTTEPSKLKKGSKDSKRRKSFCARSNGQKKMHNIDCSKTPDKAICAARRRWNCEEDIEQLEQALAEAAFGTEPKRPARSGSRPARGHNSEPRYKSAPVVPGGDNPDAVHKPNKGDEPVQRGDQVVVQDPDNIATVFTGTVKRIGREHVYVTLRNGETIAAPHDEVSKNYEVLSKRAHNILNKKGPSRSNYKVDEETLDEGKGYDTVNALVGTYNASVGGDQFSPLDVKSPGARVWTRGDGVRHRDPGRIQYENDVAAKKWPKAMSQFWQWLTTQPGVKSIGQVSGEFSTSAMMNAVRLGSLYFALTQYNTIVWGSVSRFKNPRSVWRHNPPNQGVAEGYKPRSKIEELIIGVKSVSKVEESMCAKHISPSGAETTMCPDDDDYEINYGKNSGIDDFRKKNGLNVRTGKKVKEECAGVGIVTKQNSTADVGPGTIKKNLKAFKLAQESHDDDDYVQQLTSEFIRRAKLGRRYVSAETILGLLDRFFKKFAINDRYFDDVYHRAVRTTDHEAGILEMGASLEEWKASRQLCRSSTPDSELGASALASCKSQGLRARDGNKSHKLGKSPKSRMKMGGHRIKGKKYGGPIPDWS